jgi:hypothetical protein
MVSSANQKVSSIKNLGLYRQYIQMELLGLTAELSQNDSISGELHLTSVMHNHLNKGHVNNYILSPSPCLRLHLRHTPMLLYVTLVRHFFTYSGFFLYLGTLTLHSWGRVT